MSGELRPSQAIERGTVRITGDVALFERFVELFHIPGPSRADAHDA